MNLLIKLHSLSTAIIWYGAVEKGMGRYEVDNLVIAAKTIVDSLTGWGLSKQGGEDGGGTQRRVGPIP